ncbi:M48 family metalloprotease [Roseovarius salinarum]|uniref:M48 family metalloprotease n=1 Tax=Roseovarius salinarum TaxID=1981892 RepID=UPI000C327790|nr:M48 family metalloprotease [Roseovarius salinarum]
MKLFRLAALCALLAVALADPARALSLLRDPDIEHALNRLSEPVLKAAGLSPTRTQILMIDDRSLNAFVIDRDHIFLHSGLILKMDTPAMLQAVIAHEAAHITNGHLARRPVNMRNARTAAGLGMALAAMAGAISGSPDAAAGIALGTQNTARRVFFSHTRAEESSADRSAMRFLARADVDPRGMVEVMDVFRGQEALMPGRQDPYARTHPLSRDRYRVLDRLAETYADDGGKADAQARYWFARAKHKLSAFIRSPKWTLNRAGESGYADVAKMREAIAWHRRSQLDRALPAIDAAIAQRPDDAFLLELKGQILMESRRFDAAAAAYGRAVELAPDNALILGAHGRALLAQGRTGKALQVLERARARDGQDPRVLRDLAVAHARAGNKGQASVVTAERYAMSGRLEDAALHAKRASDLLPRGSTAWQRAQDVLSAAKTAKADK